MISRRWTCSATRMSLCWTMLGTAQNSNLVYHAVYVALADVLDAVLLICDLPLARAPGMARRVVLVRSERPNR